MTATTKAKPTVMRLTVAPPGGLRVSEKLLRDYRSWQDRLANPELDRHGIDRTAEKLESRIRRACDLMPWTPVEVYRWTYGWLHVLAYGQQAK